MDESNRILQLGKDPQSASPLVSYVPRSPSAGAPIMSSAVATVIAVIILLAGLTIHLCMCASDRNSRHYILEREK